MDLLICPRKLLAALALAGLGAVAHADVVRIEAHDGYFDIVQSNSFAGPAALWSVDNQTTGDSFLAYCLELLESVSYRPQTYTSVAYAPSADIEELFDRFYASSITSAENAIGFQLALWDLLGQASAASMTTGLPGARAVALEMLDTVHHAGTGYQSGQYRYIRWSSNGYQDILQVLADNPNEVPEPQTAALMLGGLGLMGMGLASRRRKALRTG